MEGLYSAAAKVWNRGKHEGGRSADYIYISGNLYKWKYTTGSTPTEQGSLGEYSGKKRKYNRQQKELPLDPRPALEKVFCPLYIGLVAQY